MSGLLQFEGQNPNDSILNLPIPLSIIVARRDCLTCRYIHAFDHDFDCSAMDDRPVWRDEKVFWDDVTEGKSGETLLHLERCRLCSCERRSGAARATSWMPEAIERFNAAVHYQMMLTERRKNEMIRWRALFREASLGGSMAMRKKNAALMPCRTNRCSLFIDAFGHVQRCRQLRKVFSGCYLHRRLRTVISDFYIPKWSCCI